METNNSSSSIFNFEKLVDLIIRLGVLFLLLSWCFDILKPFVLVLVWATIIAVAINPIFNALLKFFRGRKLLAAIVLTSLLLSLILIPSYLIGESLYSGINHLRGMFVHGKSLIPPPGETTANWPAITKPIVDIWQSASDNLQATALRYSRELKVTGALLLAGLAGVGLGALQFIASILVAGILMAYRESFIGVSKNIFRKLGGENGDHFAEITVITIRNVVKGFLGVALIQSIMVGLGFFLADVPFAGLWTVGCLILAVVQVGVGLIVIPVGIYMFSVTDNTTATILAVWLVITMISDNVLKPILLGTGNPPAPMPVVFLGAVGGFILNGFLGLFLGAVILTLGYKLFLDWLNIEKPQA